MENGAYILFSATASCHGLFKELASKLKGKSCVTSVTHWLDIYSFDSASRLEEFVDAELLNGKAISWRLELTLTADAVTLEADVREIHDMGQDLIANIADCRYLTLGECAAGMVEAVGRLTSVNPIDE